MIQGGYFVQASGMSIPCKQSTESPSIFSRKIEGDNARRVVCKRLGISQVEV